MNNLTRTGTERRAIDAAMKNEYEKEGVHIIIGGLSGVTGWAFEMKAEDITIKRIVVDGKLRRAERRKIIKALMMALETNYLFPMGFLKNKNIRGVAVDYAKPEVKR